MYRWANHGITITQPITFSDAFTADSEIVIVHSEDL